MMSHERRHQTTAGLRQPTRNQTGLSIDRNRLLQNSLVIVRSGRFGCDRRCRKEWRNARAASKRSRTSRAIIPSPAVNLAASRALNNPLRLRLSHDRNHGPNQNDGQSHGRFNQIAPRKLSNRVRSHDLNHVRSHVSLDLSLAMKRPDLKRQPHATTRRRGMIRHHETILHRATIRRRRVSSHRAASHHGLLRTSLYPIARSTISPQEALKGTHKSQIL